MDHTEAKARMMHVVRTLIVNNMPLEDIRKMQEEAYTEVVKETFFITRKF